MDAATVRTSSGPQSDRMYQSERSQGNSDRYGFFMTICTSAQSPMSKMTAVREIKMIGVVSNISASFRSLRWIVDV